MRKRRLVHVIGLIFLGYALFQVVLYGLIHKKDEDISSKKILPVRVGRNDIIHTSVSFLNVRDLILSAHAHGIALFVLDPVVLNKVINIKASVNKKCHFFCDIQHLTIFGVLHQLWNHNGSFLHSLRGQNFTVDYIVEESPDIQEFLSLEDHATIYTHYRVRRDTHSIHIVVIYERPAGYWWHGPMNYAALYPDQHKTQVNDILKPFTRAAAYDSMELIKVTMDGLQLRAPRYPPSVLRQIEHSTFIMCNKSRARLFHSKYGEPGEDAETFRHGAKATLTKLKQALDYLGIRFWLSSGTCLGWYRQCDTIAYSGDVDVGVYIKDYDTRLIPAMQEAGFVIKYIFGKESDSFELTFHQEDMKLDIFFFYEEQDHIWNGGTQIKTRRKFKYIFPKIRLCWTEFLELKLPVPCDPGTYLQANYGQNWFEPVINWDWKHSPPNVQNNGIWPEDEWDKVVVSFD